MTFACFLAGSLIWVDFIMISLNEIKSPRVILNAKGFDPFMSGNYIFKFTIGFIPLLHFGVNKISNITSIKEKLLSLCIILFFGLFFWQGRILAVILKIQKDVSLTKSLGPDIMTEYLTKQFQPQLYLTLGIIIGAILSIVIFRKKNFANQE